MTENFDVRTCEVEQIFQHREEEIKKYIADKIRNKVIDISEIDEFIVLCVGCFSFRNGFSVFDCYNCKYSYSEKCCVEKMTLECEICDGHHRKYICKWCSNKKNVILCSSDQKKINGSRCDEASSSDSDSDW